MSRRVLVVDDDQPIRTMVRSILSRQGFEVDMADSGKGAIACLNEVRYDAFVLDVMMGDGSGHDVLQAIATQRIDQCVVIISATSPANLEAIDPANVRVKLRKPFDISELVASVVDCIGPGEQPTAAA